jgi:hypothetical protein
MANALLGQASRMVDGIKEAEYTYEEKDNLGATAHVKVEIAHLLYIVNAVV